MWCISMKRIFSIMALFLLFLLISNVSAENVTLTNFDNDVSAISYTGDRVDHFYDINTVNESDFPEIEEAYVSNPSYGSDMDNAPLKLNVIVQNRTLDGNATIIVQSSNITSGKIEFGFLEGRLFNFTNSSVICNVNGLEKGVSSFSMFYSGDDNYRSAYYSFISFSMPGFNSTLAVSNDNIVMYCGNGTRYGVTLYDDLSRPMKNKKIKLEVNGARYERTTNENGTAFLNLNLRPGNYTIDAIYSGSFKSVSGDRIKSNLAVLPTLNSSDLVKVYRNASQYYVQALDGQGSLLVNHTLSFNINGVFYNRTTNENGIAKLNINLSPGKYIISVRNPVGGYMLANNITVLPTIQSSNLVKIYRNASQFVFAVIDTSSNPVSNAEVTMNINGVFYKRTTDNNGLGSLNINLLPGKYIITTENSMDGCKVANIIEVTPYLFTQDLVKYYKNSSQFNVRLVDSNYNPIANSEITFSVLNREYKRITDNNGECILNINLLPGTYEIKTSSSDIAVSNTLKILETLIDEHEGEKINVVHYMDEIYTVKVLDGAGKAYANQNVTFNYLGKDYVIKSDEKGIAGFEGPIMGNTDFNQLTITYNGHSISKSVRFIYQVIYA